MGEHVHANDLDIWTEQVGEGPEVLLIGGLGDTVESWQFQLDGLADRYRLTAFDNRGAGRTAMPDGPVSIEVMADDAAGVLRALDVASAHVAGFSGRQHHRPGAGDAPSGAGTQPRPAEHVGGAGHLPDPMGPVRALADRGGPERARVPRGVLPRHLHPTGAQRRNGRPDHRGGARLPAQAGARRRAALPRRVLRPRRSQRPPEADRRADARARRRGGHPDPPAALPRASPS